MEALAASVALMAILLGILLLVAFDVFCLVHLVATDRVRFLPKLAWAVAIVCISPLGGAVYLLCQRQPKRSPGPPARTPAPSRATLAATRLARAVGSGNWCPPSSLRLQVWARSWSARRRGPTGR